MCESVNIESLEARKLFSAFAQQQGTNLVVTGTDHNDVIGISSSAGKIKATLNGQTQSFNAGLIQGIICHGEKGDDLIRNDTNLPSTLLGDGGQDTLVGGSGDDSLDGGVSNDTLRPRDGNNVGDLDLSGDILDYAGAMSGNFGLLMDGVNKDVLRVARPDTEDRFSCNISAHSQLHFFATDGDDQISGYLPIAADFHGGKGNDSFQVGGDSPNVFVFGDEGNDFIQASGEDFFVAHADGGPGNDTYDYTDAHTSAGPFADTGGGRDKLTVNVSPDENNPYHVTVPAGIEACDVIAGTDQTTVALTGNSLNNLLTVDGTAATISGGGGSDTLIGTGGNDVLYGGAGNDLLDGAQGADQLSGGSGNDTADYSTRTEALRITLDNVANDGEAGEVDNVFSDVENVLGGSANDYLQGNPSFNYLQGNAGDDTLWGGAGNDTLNGGPGKDRLYGQAGDDRLLAKDGKKDFLDGGDDSDTATRDNGPSVFDSVLNIETFIA